MDGLTKQHGCRGNPHWSHTYSGVGDLVHDQAAADEFAMVEEPGPAERSSTGSTRTVAVAGAGDEAESDWSGELLARGPDGVGQRQNWWQQQGEWDRLPSPGTPHLSEY
jgi:hypothetical protein